MLGNHKKRNPAPVNRNEGDGNQQALLPKEMPPLRTFVVYGPAYGFRPFPGEQLAANDPRGLTVEAHGLAIDEERMLSFFVFFWADGALKQQPAQAMKLVLNANAWDEVEEINPLFPSIEKH